MLVPAISAILLLTINNNTLGCYCSAISLLFSKVARRWAWGQNQNSGPNSSKIAGICEFRNHTKQRLSGEIAGIARIAGAGSHVV